MKSLIGFGSLFLLLSATTAGCFDDLTVGGDDAGVSGHDAGVGGHDAGVGGNDGGVCVDVKLTSFDTSCAAASDCTLVRVGNICDGQCSCGDTPINQSGLAHWQTDTSGLSLEGCPCAFPGTPQCIAGECTLCTGQPGQPAGCSDGGAVDAAVGDGGVCVDVKLTSFDTSCTAASDCIIVPTGTVCTGQCDCGDTPINQSGLAQWQADTSGLSIEGCICAPHTTRCIAGECTVCDGEPGQPAGCSDGG